MNLIPALQLGRDRDREALVLPLDFATARASLVGMSGAGKSNALALMVEQCYAHAIAFTYVDPLGAAWGLRAAADGVGVGIAVPIFGGYHGDLPLRSDAGALVARELYELDISAVLDLSAFSPDEQSRFTTDLVLQMMKSHHLRKKVRSLFVDEAATLAPQVSNSKDDNACTVALWRVHTGGRALGIGLKTATQSAADQSKRTMKQSEIFVALRTASPLDQKPILEYVRTSVDAARSKEIAATLSHLDDGEAWFIAPRWIGEVRRARFDLRSTFDSSRTPKVGEHVAPPKQLAPVDLERLRGALAADVAKEESSRDSSPDLADALKQAREMAAFYRSQNEHLHAAGLVLLTAVQKAVDELSRQIAPALKAFVENNYGVAPVTPAHGVIRANDHKAAEPEAPRHRVVRGSVSAAASPPSVPRPPRAPADGAPSFRAGARRMLQACAQFAIRGLTKSQIVALAKVKAGGTFSTYLGELERAGFVYRADGRYKATPHGIRYLAGDVPMAPKSAREVLERWRGEFRAGAQRMLDVIVDAHPATVSRKQLADRAGVVNGGTFSTYLGELIRAELVEESDGQIRATIFELLKG